MRNRTVRYERPVTWLCTALALASALLLLYIPFQFQGEAFRLVYPYLRPMGSLFAVSAILMAVGLSDIGLPRRYVELGRILFLLTTGGSMLGQILASGFQASMVTTIFLGAAFLVSGWWPHTETILFRAVYLFILVWTGLTVSVGRVTNPAAYGRFPYWIDLLFIAPGLLQVFGYWPRSRPRWLTTGTMLLTLLPLSYLAVLVLGVRNWVVAGLTLTLFAGAVIHAVYLWRPWAVHIPGLRRRILMLALCLAVIPTLGFGAYAVYRLQVRGQQQSLETLSEVAAHLRSELTLATAPELNLPATATGVRFVRPWLHPDVDARVYPLDAAPTTWPQGTGVLTFEDEEHGTGRHLMAIVRQPDLGIIIVVSQKASLAYGDATATGVNLLLGALVVAAAATASGLVLSTRITSQLAKVQNLITAVGQQQFHAKGLVDADDDDEIAHLAGTVQEMAAALESYNLELHARNDALQLQAEEILSQNEALRSQSETLEAQAMELRKATTRSELEHRRLSAILSVLPVGVFITDHTGKMLEANVAARQIWGDPPLAETLEGYAQYKAWRAGSGQPAHPHNWGIVRSLASGEAVIGDEYIIEAFDGRRKTILASVAPVFDESNVIINAVSVVVDITERKQMEEELLAREALLADKRQVLEQMATGESVSDVLATIARFTEHRVGGYCSILLNDENKSQLRVAAGQAMPADLLQAAVASEGTYSDAAQRLTLTDGHHCWLYPVTTGDGERLGSVAITCAEERTFSAADMGTIDIAANLTRMALERHRLEEGQVLKLHSLLENMAEGVVAIDGNRTLVFMNSAAANLLQTNLDPHASQLEELQLPDPLASALARCSEPGNSTPERITFSREGKHMEAHVSPVFTDFGRYGSIAVLQDVTAEQQFRRLQESFVANVSHELRGPLASISVAVEALSDGIIVEEQRPRYFRAVLGEMARLRRLSNDVIDLTCLDSGISRVKTEVVNLSHVFENLRDRHAHRSQEEQLELHIDETDLHVMGDPDRVDQVLTNLLENAIRFTPAGGTIHVSAWLEDGKVRIAVSDTGKGIPAEHLPYVWGRFYKVDQARTLIANTGTGLGLAIVYQLVQLMGGTVHVESEPEKGATFSFALPTHVYAEQY